MIDVEAVSEDNFPATPASVPAVRTGVEPTTHYRSANSDGVALADSAGAWANVGNAHRNIFRGFDFASGVTHRFAVYAKRSGSGVPDQASNILFRLIRKSDSAVICTTATGHGAVADYDSTTTFANVPGAADGYDTLILQYKTENGEDAVFYAASWETDEITVVKEDSPVSIHTIIATHDAAGVDITVDGRLNGPEAVMTFGGWYGYNTTVRVVAEVDPNGADFDLQLKFYGDGADYTIYDFGNFSGAGGVEYREAIILNDFYINGQLYVENYAAGTGKFYGLAVFIENAQEDVDRRFLLYPMVVGATQDAAVVPTTTGFETLTTFQYLRQGSIAFHTGDFIFHILGFIFRYAPGTGVDPQFRFYDVENSNVLLGPLTITLDTPEDYWRQKWAITSLSSPPAGDARLELQIDYDGLAVQFEWLQGYWLYYLDVE